MLWLRLFIGAVLLIGALFVVLQVIIPMCMGRKLVPMFRKNEAALRSEIVDLNQQIHEQELQGEVDTLKKQLQPATPSVVSAPVVTDAPVVPETPAATEQKTETSTQP